MLAVAGADTIFSSLPKNTKPIAVELISTVLLDGKIELAIPTAFEIMSEERMKIKYPSAQRPSLVYTNESGEINVALNYTESPANPQLLPAYKDNFVQTFERMHPTADWRGSGLQSIQGKEIGYLELITPAIDTDIYNLLFFTDLEGKLLLFTFNCTKRHLEEWAPRARAIMDSLRVLY